MGSTSRDAATAERRGGARRLVAAVVPAALALHAYLAFGVLSQPLDAGRAAPAERAPTWGLFHDSVHRAGPGADLFAVYHAGVAAGRGDSLYTRIESPRATPYFFPFRYLPIVADSLGRAFSRLAPRTAYFAWGALLEAALALSIFLVWRIARNGWERVFGATLLALSTPFLLELHMGQSTFLAAVLLLAAAFLALRISSVRRDRVARALALRSCEIASVAAATLLKLFPLAVFPLWLKEGRRAILGAASIATAALAAVGFALHPTGVSAFVAANFTAPSGGLDAGNFGPAYALLLIIRGSGSEIGDAAFAAAASHAHLLIVGASLAIVLLSRERNLLVGAGAVVAAHFASYVHVWEHHASAALLVGLAVWLARRDLSIMPSRAWSALVALCLVLLALPTPFALFDTARDPSVWDPSADWSTGVKLAVAGSKALPLAALWLLFLAPHLWAGLALPAWWRRALPLTAASLALVASLTYFSFGSPGTWSGFPLDDAWIHRVYARAFAAGHGFQYNVGADEVGATSPLWVVITSPAEWLAPVSAGAVVIAVKAIGAICAAAFVAGVFATARALAPASSRWTATLACLLVAADPRLAFSLLSGMENALAAALWIWTAFAAVSKRRSLLALLAALLPAARPEAALLLPLAWWAILAPGGGGTPLRRAALVAATIVPLAAWCAFCLHTTGHPLPNTFYVKATVNADAATVAANAFFATIASGLPSTPLLPLGIVGFIAALWKERRALAVPFALLVALPAVYALAVSASRAVRLDGYYWTRWFDPAALILGVAAAIGTAHLARVFLESARRRPSGGVGFVAVLAVVAVSAFCLASDAAKQKIRFASDTAVIERTNVAAGKWIAEHAERGEVVGAHDAGAVKYFGRRPTIDFGGLNTHALAFDWSLAKRSLDQATWLVVFPKKLAGTNALDGFALRATFAVPEEAYTICDCPLQTELAVYRRARSSPRR